MFIATNNVYFSKHKDHTSTVLVILKITYSKIKFCFNGKFHVPVTDHLLICSASIIQR